MLENDIKHITGNLKTQIALLEFTFKTDMKEKATFNELKDILNRIKEIKQKILEIENNQ